MHGIPISIKTNVEGWNGEKNLFKKFFEEKNKKNDNQTYWKKN